MSDIALDKHIHVIPLDGPEHMENEGCWCEPEMVQEIDELHHKRVYLHKELQ